MSDDSLKTIINVAAVGFVCALGIAACNEYFDNKVRKSPPETFTVARESKQYNVKGVYEELPDNSNDILSVEVLYPSKNKMECRWEESYNEYQYLNEVLVKTPETKWEQASRSALYSECTFFMREFLKQHVAAVAAKEEKHEQDLENRAKKILSEQ